MNIYCEPQIAFAEDWAHTAHKVGQAAQAVGVLTGSRAFGVATDKSDFDYIVKERDVPWLDIERLDEHCFGKGLPSLGCKIYLCEKGWVAPRPELSQEEWAEAIGLLKTINAIVCTTDTEFDGWVEATRQMTRLCEDPVFRQKVRPKPARIKVFEVIREVYGIK